MNIEVHDLKQDGYMECPRCRVWHHNELNPLATTTREKLNPDTKKREPFETVNPICDKCCDTLLEAFADLDWKLFWPLVTDEEATTIVSRIKTARQKQLMRFRAA